MNSIIAARHVGCYRVRFGGYTAPRPGRINNFSLKAA